MYSIQISSSAKKSLVKVPKRDRNKIAERIEKLIDLVLDLGHRKEVYKQ